MERFTTGLEPLNNYELRQIRRQLEGSLAWEHGQVSRSGVFEVLASRYPALPELGRIKFWSADLVGSTGNTRVSVLPYADIKVTEAEGSSPKIIPFKELRTVHPRAIESVRLTEDGYLLPKGGCDVGNTTMKFEELEEKLKMRLNGRFVDPVCDLAVAEVDPQLHAGKSIWQIVLRKLGVSGVHDIVVLADGKFIGRDIRRPFSFDEQIGPRR